MPSTPARVLGDHPQPGACFIHIHPNEIGPTNAEGKLGAPPPSHPGESGDRAKMNGVGCLSGAQVAGQLEPHRSGRAEFSVGPVFSRMSLLKRQSTSTLPHVLRRLHVRVRARTDRSGERCVRLPSKSRPLSTHDGLIRTPPRPDRGSNRGSNPSARLEPFSPAVRLLPGPPPSQSTHTAVTLSLTAHTLWSYQCMALAYHLSMARLIEVDVLEDGLRRELVGVGVGVR